ncbi:Crp/Fnr family transcriptional regulator [uncultured Chryseobacterium sp.]|uniref:Crp/Fnr family transcriptional regulator n=1 Tax=uncultured Chryseobacterium sp. TaxID=259322 RepID=UPI0025CF55DB|nr:Crp/Fnr family transcriptional regulator [uncultured Chryseobacterium sp.]
MLSTLDPKIFSSIEENAEHRDFRKGEYLFHQDEVCRKIFWIRKGICRNYYLHDGKEITTEILFPGDFLKSAKSFVLDIPAQEFAQAITDVETWSLTRSRFNSLKEQHPELQKLGLYLVERHSLWLEDRLFQFQTQDATTLYLNLIQRCPEMIKTVPLTYIASYLGISLETLSRIRSRIAKNII